MGIFAGFLLVRASNESGVVNDGNFWRSIFGDLSGYFFGIFRDKASNIIWRYANPCRTVTDCKMNDLERPWVAIWRQNPFSASTRLQNSCVFWSPMRQKCRPMNLVSGNIRFMRIFAGCRLRRVCQMTLGVVDDGNFWRFRWLRLRKLQRYGKHYYMTTCYPLSAGNWLQNEWPWMTLSGYFMSKKSVFGQHFLNQGVLMSKTIQSMWLCGVLCIARSASQPGYTCAADALFLCGSWASCTISR